MEEDKQLPSAAPSPESSSESIQPETQESQSSSQPQQLSTQPLTQYQETTTTNANNDDTSYNQLKYTQQETSHFSYGTQPTTQPFTNTQQMTQPAVLHEPQQQLGVESQDDNNIGSQSLSQDQPITQPLTQVFNNSTTKNNSTNNNNELNINSDNIDNGSCSDSDDQQEHLHESEQDIVEMMVFQNDFIGNSQNNIDDPAVTDNVNVDVGKRIDNNESSKEIMGFDYNHNGTGEKQAAEQSSLLVEEQQHDNVLDTQQTLDETRIDEDTSKPPSTGDVEQLIQAEVNVDQTSTKQHAMLINVPDDVTGKTPCLSQQPDDDDNIEDGNTVAPSLPPPPPTTTTTTTTTTTPHQKQNTVTNPYTKKRSIDQISQRSNSTNSSGSGNSSSSTAGQNRQVFNPYAKSRQTPKPSVRNPYARMNNGSGASSPKPPRSTSPKPPPRSTSPKPPPSTIAQSTSINKVNAKAQQQHPPISQLAAFKQPPSIAPVAPPKLPTFRRAGISISLPMAERLPSRNVSYQPAEILSVGELYRYLYLTGEEEDTEQQEQSSSTESGISKELISVRITGTLLCVASSNIDTINGSKGKLYDSGTYLLLGDPLENTRLTKKEAPPQAQQSDPLSAASDPKTALKPGLTSILRKKITSTVSSETSASFKPTPALKSTQSNLSRQQKEQTSTTTTATPAVEESTSINRESAIVNNIGNKSSTTRGILNTKKRLSFGGGGLGGGGGKRLSFGGKGLGGGKGSVGGGLVGSRKFQTPKRINTTRPLSSVKKNSTTNNRIGGLTTSTVKKSVYSSAKSVGSGKNPRPEYIIQCHPSPIVPVWIGSFYNGDGLDGSVIGDLVMIMGELVIEHCASCQTSHAAVANESVEDTIEEEGCTDNRPQHSTQSQQQGVSGAANSIAASASQISGASSIPQSQTPSRKKLKGRTFCCQCTRFLRARLVKNANGTDMNLQREALKARREYLIERKRQMKMLIPNSTTTSNQSSNSVYSVGCGHIADS